MNSKIDFEALLCLNSEQLLSQCQREAYQASGAGGQKRNRILSGIRLVHKGTGIRAEDCSGREAHRNLQNALHKLRLEIAWQASFSDQIAPIEKVKSIPKQRISKENFNYVWFIWLVNANLRTNPNIEPILEILSWSKSSFLRQVGRDGRLSHFFHQVREDHGLARWQLPS